MTDQPEKFYKITATLDEETKRKIMESITPEEAEAMMRGDQQGSALNGLTSMFPEEGKG